GVPPLPLSPPRPQDRHPGVPPLELPVANRRLSVPNRNPRRLGLTTPLSRLRFARFRFLSECGERIQDEGARSEDERSRSEESTHSCCLEGVLVMVRKREQAPLIHHPIADRTRKRSPKADPGCIR